MTTNELSAGSPPDDVVRLLRLLSRRGASIALTPATTGTDCLEITVACGVVGIATPATLRVALSHGVVEMGASGGDGRISHAGRTLLRRLRSGEGAPDAGCAPAAAPPLTASEQDHSESPTNSHGDRPGFDLDESPLAWLARRRDKAGRPLIEAIEFEAGERFRADFHFAQLGPRVTANWSLEAPRGRGRRSGGPAPVELRDNVVAAQERVRRALAAVGPELAGVLIDVCGHLKGLETAERGAGWPARSGKVVLQLALKALARHYGIAAERRLEQAAERRLEHAAERRVGHAAERRVPRDSGAATKA